MVDGEAREQRSAPFSAGNLLDRLSRQSTLHVNYRLMQDREARLVARRVNLPRGEVLSVGAGWHPGRHLFPAARFHLTAVDADPHRVAGLRESGRADEVLHGQAGQLPFAPDSFDVVLYRLVLHHIAFQGPLAPAFAEASRLLRPGGVLIAVEPGLWHPVGALLALANALGLGTAVHGTPDDIPISPRRLMAEARGAGLDPELHAVTYGWRRLPPSVQRALHLLDAVGSRPRAAQFGHTLMLIARKPAQ